MAKKIKNKKKIYGMELILELFDCDLKNLTSKEKIKEFVNSLCQAIKMKKHGPIIIERYKGGGLFGEGYSFFQFITTSSITGHFIEPDRIAFINIFSCNVFNSKNAANFTQKFFQAKRIKNRLIIH